MKIPIQAPALPFNRSAHWLILAFAAIILALGGGGAWFYHAQENQLREEALENLQVIAQSKRDQVVAWRTERLDDAAEVSEHPYLSSRISAYLSNPSPELEEAILERFRALRQFRGYSDVILVDDTGQVRLSLLDEAHTLHAETAEAVQAALRERRPLLTDLVISASLPPHIDLVAPIYSSSASGRHAEGAVVMAVDASAFLYPLLESWPTPSASAEGVLLRRDGDAALYLTNLRARPGSALRLRVPLTNTDLPAVKAVLGERGAVEGLDYRGVAVIAYLDEIPGTPWYIITKIDVDEALAVWKTRAVSIVAGLLGLCAALAATGGFILQNQNRQYYKSLYLAEAARRKADARYRTTLMSIGDGVIATDAQGRVELLNPLAEALTGWKEAEARGRPLAEVFKIINEETRQDAPNPVDEILRRGASIGLTNHTLLVDRGGVERPIAESGAPIRGSDGEISGVALVFHDQSEQREALRVLRENEEKFSTVFNASPNILTITRVKDRRLVDVNPGYETATGYTRAEVLGKTTLELGIWDNLPAAQAGIARLLREGVTTDDELEFRRKDGMIRVGLFSARLVVLNGEQYSLMAGSDITERRMIEKEHQVTAELLRITDTAASEHEVFSALTTCLQEWSHCEAVGIRLQEGDDYPYFEVNGFPERFLKTENYLCSYHPDGSVERDAVGKPIIECMCGNILCGRFDPAQPFFTAGGSFWSNSTTALLASTSEAERQSRTRNRCNGEGYESVALVPLRVGQETFGLLQFNDPAQNRFSLQLIHQFEHVANTIATSLAKRRVEKQLEASQERFRAIYEYSSVPIWEEDFSQIKIELDRLRASGVSDLRAYFDSQLEEVQRLAALVKILDINQESVRFHQARDKSELTLELPSYFVPESYPVFKEELLALAGGAVQFSSEVPIYNHKIGHRLLNLHLSVVPGCEDTLKQVLISFWDITERKAAEEQVRKSLNEKEILLRELYHRTKNNMQVIRAMLILQSTTTENEEVHRLVEDTGDKIQTMALVHQMLYQSQDLSSINIRDYVQELSWLALSSMKTDPAQVALDMEIQPVLASIDIATPLGLILNELFSNALKHAFPDGRSGTVSVRMERRGETTLWLKFADDGIGLPPGFDLRRQKTYGLMSVFSLVEHQLGGSVKVDTHAGLSYEIQFSTDQYQNRI